MASRCIPALVCQASHDVSTLLSAEKPVLEAEIFVDGCCCFGDSCDWFVGGIYVLLEEDGGADPKGEQDKKKLKELQRLLALRPEHFNWD